MKSRATETTKRKLFGNAGMAILAAGIFCVAAAVCAQERWPESQVVSDSTVRKLAVFTDGQLLTVSARNAARQDILDAISTQIDLRVVRFAELRGIVSLSLQKRALSNVLAHILHGYSYQLFQPHSSPAVLWIFSEGQSAASARIQTLESELLHGDKRTRRNAVIALRKIGSMETVEPLSFALTDEDPDISIRAVYALADIGGADALTALASASADADSWVRAEAAVALASIGGEAAVSHLGLTLHDPDSNTRAAVIASLADNPGESSAQLLAIALQDPDPLIRMEAVDALEEMGGGSARRVLSQAESNQDADVEFAIDETLSALDGAE